MTDVVSKATRSRMMAGIKVSKTKPEMQVRALLRGCGYRRSYNVKSLPGCPDIVIRSQRIAIFVHGCFWHRHNCQLFKWPRRRSLFWKAKLNGNFQRDVANLAGLVSTGWRVLVVWQCALVGRGRRSNYYLESRIRTWLTSTVKSRILIGRPDN